MAEQENAPNQPQFAIQRVYIKDVSFETPNVPAVFQASWEPKVDLNLHTGANKLGDGVYEVVLTVTVTTKVGETTAYLAEVHQAGIFSIIGFDEQQVGHMIGAYCPNILFPFAREAVADLVVKGSFPQLLLAPVNFDALYADHLHKQQEAGAESNH